MFGINRKKENEQLQNVAGNGERLITINDPKNPIAEQFRTIRTNIDFLSASGKKITNLLISSSISSEGKSTTAANLAIVYSQQDKKVLLVDADLRRPTVGKTFKLPSNTIGLTNYLADRNKSISDIVHKTEVNGLDVVSSGPIPPNPTELLGSIMMTKFIEQMTTKYDIVIYDVPPLTLVADAQVLIPKIDGVVLVINAGETTKNSLRHTVDALKISNANLLGFVYNNKNQKNNKDAAYGYEYKE